MALLQIVATMQLFIEPLILANGAGAQDSPASVATSSTSTGSSS